MGVGVGVGSLTGKSELTWSESGFSPVELGADFDLDSPIHPRSDGVRSRVGLVRAEVGLRLMSELWVQSRPGLRPRAPKKLNRATHISKHPISAPSPSQPLSVDVRLGSCCVSR